jgi:hypothetical protein
MIDLCVVSGLISKEELDTASDNKIAKLKVWSDIFKEETNETQSK